MTRRERLERRVEQRTRWASSRARKADQTARAADLSEERSGIPFGQPVLVGHHSERRHRRAIDKAARAMHQTIEHAAAADKHANAAATLRARLDVSVYSDDADAIEALERRAAEHDAEADRAVEINATYRRGGLAAVRQAYGDAVADRCARTVQLRPSTRQVVSSTSARAAARRDRERIEQIRCDRTRQAEHAKATAAAGGVVLTERPDGGASLAFPERPPRPVLDALRAAGWRFRAGAWYGLRSTLPAIVEVTSTVTPPPPDPAVALAVVRARLTRLVVALRATPHRDVLVVLSRLTRAGEPDAEIWRGPLSGWLEQQDPAVVSCWEPGSWRTVQDLSLGRGVLLYLGDATETLTLGLAR